MARSERPGGRYDRRSLQGSFEPAGILPQGRHGKLDIVHAAVADPERLASEKLKTAKVAINRNGDVLEAQYSAGKISKAAYCAASAYQTIMTREVSAGGGGQWREGDRVDVQIVAEFRMIAQLDAARAKVALLEQTGPIIGWQGERLFKLTLIDGLSLAEAAWAMFKDDGKRTALHTGWLFKQSCELLGEHCKWLAQMTSG